MPRGVPVRTLSEWLALQESVHPRSIDLGLERVSTVACALGVAAPGFAVLTVGGTNGKGSVAAHLEALLGALGASTGLFISPHFLRYHERIRIDGTEVNDTELITAFADIEAARGATTLTFFEYNTLAALLIFTRREVEAAVLEVGLGGRLDATNLVSADVAVLASVGFDHRDWLGDTLELIGAEKAGIFRPQCPAVLGTPEMPASVFAALTRLGAPAVVAERDFTWRVHPRGWDYSGLATELRDLPPSALAGAIQYRNAATALAAVEALRTAPAARASVRALSGRLAPCDAQRVSAALARVRLAGRFQVLPGAVEWILDIAHNEPAARNLAAELAARALPKAHGAAARAGRTFAVLGILADKDAAAIGAALAPVIDCWILCTLPGPRGLAAEELAARLALPEERVQLATSVVRGCEAARAAAQSGDRIVVCGSVYAVGPALEW
ncbi:MAG: bifunctional tetrahydrofolate synthase/dihydrofolate synthase, partial [Gammaproteobacteria bacterium]|nr:bifunctional tetrahydrofolate synthase/dihydrofolate synthase [Gammaproteobacteria bacterium]